MSLDFQKLTVKKFKTKTYKQSHEARYWKKFLPLLCERDASNMQIADLAFGLNNLLAVAVSARVDLYTLKQPESQDDVDFDKLTPSNQIFKFDDVATAVNFRSDGQLLLTGESSGKIQLFELKNRFALRNYTMGKNRVNALSFSDNSRNFLSCANDTCIRYFDIQDSSNSCAIEISSAHSDNIKKVQFISEQSFISASSDRTVKLWDLRNTAKAVSTFKLENQIEDFAILPNQKLIVAQGNTLTLAKIENDQIRRQNDFYPFQKPCTRVRYDKARERVIAGGMDQQLKFFQITGSDQDQLQLAYKIKVPSEIVAFDVSHDGSHFTLGLNDSSLIIRSKQLEKEDAKEDDVEAKLYAQFAPKMKQTSKNYKYFNRGQYQVEVDPEDLAALKNHKKAKLQSYEHSLKKFEYKAALNKALQSGNPEVIVALIEELVERGALYVAIGGRSEEELLQLLKFLIWKVGDYRYASVLLEVTRITIDMYSAVFDQSQQVRAQLNQLIATVQQQVSINEGLLELNGEIEMIKLVFTSL